MKYFLDMIFFGLQPAWYSPIILRSNFCCARSSKNWEWILYMTSGGEISLWLLKLVLSPYLCNGWVRALFNHWIFSVSQTSLVTKVISLIFLVPVNFKISALIPSPRRALLFFILLSCLLTSISSGSVSIAYSSMLWWSFIWRFWLEKDIFKIFSKFPIVFLTF